jgi:hypothetical protein
LRSIRALNPGRVLLSANVLEVDNDRKVWEDPEYPGGEGYRAIAAALKDMVAGMAAAREKPMGVAVRMRQWQNFRGLCLR